MIGFAIFLLALWLIGVITAFTLGGLIHILLVVGVIVLIVRLLRGTAKSV